MRALRLVCQVTAPDGRELPGEDSHPYNVALDDLGEAVADFARRRGVDPDLMSFEGEDGNGSLLTMSSDAPRWVNYFWVHLPENVDAQSELLAVILEHLACAKDAVPETHWDVSLGGDPLIWDEGRFKFRN